MTLANPNLTWFTEARFGLFVHFGIYSMIGRGEWVMNRERISPDEYQRLARDFHPDRFDARAICDLAVAAGMRYVVLTTMHHDGFRLYPTRLSDFNAQHICGRDLVGEMVAATQARGLRIGLYHSLNNWMDQPDGVAAVEDPVARERFIANTHARCVELAERYPMDVFWYDGWWPFNADGWQAEALNAKIRAIRPNVLFNPRNGLPGDFATPEGHMGAPAPWRPWEACLSINDSWGFHAGDHTWKTPGQVVDLLAAAAAGRGNLLLNVGPQGDGSIPKPAEATLRAVGSWLRIHGQAVFGTTAVWSFGLMARGDHRGDWLSHGPCTVKGHALYLFLRRWPGRTLTVAGLPGQVLRAMLVGKGPCTVRQDGERIHIEGLPDEPSDPVCPVLRLDLDREPCLELGGGMRVPQVPCPPYDPCPSEVAGAPGGH